MCWLYWNRVYRFNKPNPFKPVLVWQACPRFRPSLRVVLLFKALLKQLLSSLVVTMTSRTWRRERLTYILKGLSKVVHILEVQLSQRAVACGRRELFCNSLQKCVKVQCWLELGWGWWVTFLRSVDFALLNSVYLSFLEPQKIFFFVWFCTTIFVHT